MARDRVEITVPDNWHCHWRNDVMAVWMVKMLIENGFRGRVLGMPNTKPPNLTWEDVARYVIREIHPPLLTHRGARRFLPVPAIQITKHTTPEIVRRARAAGIVVGKGYPKDVTTNSELGISNYEEEVYPAFRAMQECGMVASLHCEHPSYDVEGFFKESRFIPILEGIRSNFPRLKIMVEHVTTRAMLEWVVRQPKELVRATIAAQYCANTIDDVIGYSKRSGCKMNVHNGCKPMPKFRDDLIAMQEAATSDDPHYVYGGDDAAHFEEDKHAGACGTFNTPVALPFFIKLFKERGAMRNFDPFFSQRGAEFYGFPRLTDKIVFEEDPWIVPARYPVLYTGRNVVPLFAGEEMRHKIVS
jgi:dihydroorotase